MKRSQSILLTAGALVALIAAIALGRSHMFVPNSTSMSTSTATAVTSTSTDPLSSVSPDADTSPTSSTDGAGANGTTMATSGAAPTGQSLDVKAAAIENLNTGAVLYEYGSNVRWPLASMTKLMTAEIVSDRMNLDQTITMASSDFAVGPDTLTVNLLPGDEYTASDLLKVLLVPSSNEAAEAFARTYGRPQFIAAMNAQAAAWGLSDTSFNDPSGLSAADESTPLEFLSMVQHVYDNHPELFAITRNTSASVEDVATGAMKTFATTNDFAGRADFIGGKTGTTPQAGDNLLSIFNVGGEPIAIVVFDAANRYTASATLLQWTESHL